MPKSVWEKAGDEAREKLDQAKDFVVNADGGLENLSDKAFDSAKNSKNTRWILVGCVGAAVVIACLFALFK